ncbi:MAG: GNAT family N-acetyltransferase [Chloroflexota bacterium]
MTIRPMRDSASDLAVMARWLSDPRVLEFYEGRDRPHDVEMVRDGFLRRTEVKGETPCIVEVHGRPIGYIQFYPIDADEAAEYGLDPGEAVYGIDQFIGEPALWDQGLGRAMVRLMLSYLLGERGAARVVLDPAVDNERAIRCYQACGFRRVKLLPEHELHEGRRRDCWLMAVTRETAVY